jgi:5,10-methylenetetrahydrofolate reductase
VTRDTSWTSGFPAALASGRFLVTTEEPPPKGTDLSSFLRRTQRLLGHVDAISLTEASGAVVTMSPIGVVPALLAQGHEPILQVTCRDRNRIALQADLLAAAALGVTTVACMAGDEITEGDHPGATPVYDLDTPGLLRTLKGLGNEGRDLGGNRLSGAPALCIGAVVNPGAEDLEAELRRMEAKVEAGAQFFLTQAVYDPPAFERFMSRAERLQTPVLAGYIVPKSGDMARRLNRTLPGVQVPEGMIRRLDEVEDKVACSIELSGRIIERLIECCRGIHLIAVGWEGRMQDLLAASGISRPGARPAGHRADGGTHGN